MNITVPLKVIKPTESAATQTASIWSTLVTGIVRPPRAKYQDRQLGLKTIPLNQTIYNRADKTITHEQKHKLKLTMYQPQYKNNTIILYLHGNSSSKLQCLSILRFIPYMFSMASFDFMGCGQNNQLDIISLGYRQSKQVETVVEYLKKQCHYDVIIWGRSMGAASALLYGKVPIIVADSSFKSLRSLCKQVAKENSPKLLPNCVINCFFPCVFYKLKKDVQDKGEYDMDQCDVREAIKKIDPQTTLIFLSGDQDKLVHSRNSQKLYDAFTGDHKFIEIFKGHHNSKRPQEVIKKVMRIINSQWQRRVQQKKQPNKQSGPSLCNNGSAKPIKQSVESN